MALQPLLKKLDPTDSMQGSQRSRRRSKKGKVNVVAPQVQKAYGQEPPTTEGLLEGYYLGFLALFFVVILAEGSSLPCRCVNAALPSVQSLCSTEVARQLVSRHMVCAGLPTRIR